MNRPAAPPLLVCYIPGLDARRIDPGTMPCAHALRTQRRVVGFRTLPTTELVPSLLTGTWPHQHRIWQVSLKPEFRHGVPPRAFDRLPDLLVTTLQCAQFFFDRSVDLAALPWRRLRRFEQHRFKYTRRAESDASMQAFSGYPTLFGLMERDSKYHFTKSFQDLPALAERLSRGERRVEFLEMYALDLLQHWHLDNAVVMHEALARTDQFLADIRAACRQRGVRLLLLVDHGQEAVVGTIPLVQALQSSGVPEDEYTYYVELASARLWFHTSRARDALMPALRGLARTTLLGWREMQAVDVCFEDDAFGEVYAFADPGYVFFPHDFYQPIGNAVLGLLDRHQRQRTFNPVHRGNHGYLPHHPSEQGWMVLDDAVEPVRTEGARIIDVAPTMLGLAGVAAPAHMDGVALYGVHASN